MENVTDEEQARNRLLHRLMGLELQCTERLTPLLQKELQNLVKTHTAAVEQPHLPVELLESLDNQNERFEEHWEAFHKDYASHMKLLTQMAGLENFIRETLEEDYLGVPRRQEIGQTFELDIVALISTQRLGKGDDNSKKKYRDEILLPLRELAVDVSYVEDRLCLAAQGQREDCPRGNVVYLVEECRWEELARTLLNDRQLALDFRMHHPFSLVRHDHEMSLVVLELVDRLEHRFFENLKSPKEFRLSKHARELSAGSAVLGFDGDGMPLVSETELKPSSGSEVERTRRFLGSVMGGIKALGTGVSQRSRRDSSAVGNKADEKTPLVESQEG